MKDPFRHHPRLRALITDPSASQLRFFEPRSLDERMRAQGLPDDWRLSDADREASRRETLSRRPEGPLWVFAYGSLMWDPAVPFTEVRRANAPGHARRMILKDTLGGRGDRQRPGLMAALDEGGGCDGLAFALDEADVEAETYWLFARERAAPAYMPAFIEVDTAPGRIRALTFVADHAADLIDVEMTRGEMVRYLATGSGWLGSSLDYLRNLMRHLDALGIADAELAALLADGEALARSR